MFDKTVDTKPIVSVDGESLRDLTVSIFDPSSRPIEAYSLYKVTERYIMRPDLISIEYYGSDAYTEMILKYNGISNPFSLKEGDILLLPDIENIYKPTISKTVSSMSVSDEVKVEEKNDIRKSYKYVNPNKLKEVAKGFQSNERFDNLAIPSATSVTPYIAEENESPIRYRNGRYYVDGLTSDVAGGSYQDGLDRTNTTLGESTVPSSESSWYNSVQDANKEYDRLHSIVSPLNPNNAQNDKYPYNPLSQNKFISAPISSVPRSENIKGVVVDNKKIDDAICEECKPKKPSISDKKRNL